MCYIFLLLFSLSVSAADWSVIDDIIGNLQADYKAGDIDNKNPTPDDFDQKITKLRIMSNKKQNVDCCVELNNFNENMKEIAKIEGFNLSFTSVPYFIRDHFIHAGGQIIAPANSPAIPLCLVQSNSYFMHFNRSSCATCNHLFYLGKTGSVYGNDNRAAIDAKNILGGKSFVRTRYYFEGGNIMLMSNKDRERVLVVGEEQVVVAHLGMKKEKLLEEAADLATIAANYANNLSLEEIKEIAKILYSQGLLKINNNNGLLSQESVQKIINYRMNNRQINPANALDLSGEVRIFSWKDSYEALARKLAGQYMAERHITKEIIKLTHGVKKLYIIPQLQYHIDNFLSPGPSGIIFMQSHHATEQLCVALLKVADQINLSQQDKDLLSIYKDNAESLEKAQKTMSEESLRTLERAGFLVVKTPSLFLANNNSANINFQNAISGYSSKTSHRYYIGSGAQVGNKLGQVLMTSFEKFIKAHIPNLEVYFVGYDPNNAADFSEAMSWWNVNQAGPHCFSFTCNEQ